jgi:thymidylate kinase
MGTWRDSSSDWSDMGRLFVFEGIDGVGKSTLVEILSKRLKAKRIPCAAFAFPGNESGSLGQLVHRLHHDRARYGIKALSSAGLQLLHVAAHVDAIERNILSAYDAGKLVLLDRFWWSTWAYGKASGIPHSQLDSILAPERLAWRGIKPDTVFYLERAKATKNQKLLEAYEVLVSREQGNQLIRRLQNDADLNSVADEILSSIVPGSDGANGNNGGRSGVRTTARRSDLIIRKSAAPSPSKVYDTYWKFAKDRQEIFFEQVSGRFIARTKDPILAHHKFTNAYRASDRVSQFLIRNVIYEGDSHPAEVFFRTIVFKLFNKIETWLLLKNEFGEVRYSDYDFDKYDAVLSRALSSGARIYSAAYIMPTAKAFGADTRKHRTHLRLLAKMMKDSVPTKLADMKTMQSGFELLRSYPMLGDFLAYQFITDLNYSSFLNFSEMEFVVPGPGARDGLRKCFTDFGDLTEVDIIRQVAERQESEFARLGLKFRSLWGRPLQLIDCQNLFCEVDKYARLAHPDVPGISGRTKIKQFYRPHPSPMSYWYPPKWGLNELIHGRPEASPIASSQS